MDSRLDPVVGPLNWPKTYSIVTGVGSCEWRWSSATKAEARFKNGKWNGQYDGGADLFECLSRKTQRHTIKRVVPNPNAKTKRPVVRRTSPTPCSANPLRVIEWAKSNPRKPATIAFTDGPERQAAYWIEWALENLPNTGVRGATESRTSPPTCSISESQKP